MRRSATRSTTWPATRRYVVSLPPAIVISPDGEAKISSSRDTVGRRAVAARRRRHQRPEPGECAHHVARLHVGGGEVVVHRIEQVRDVLGLDGRRHRAVGVVGVGGADERALVPRNDEHHATVLHGVQHDGRLVAEPCARHDDVDALRGPESQRRRGVHGVHGVDPRAGGVHHRPRAHHQLATADPIRRRARRRSGPPPSRSSTTRAYDTATAPSSRAESSVSSTRRASSVQQSQYSPAPRSPSVQQLGLGLSRGLGRQHAVPLDVADAGQQIVGPEAGGELHPSHRASA